MALLANPCSWDWGISAPMPSSAGPIPHGSAVHAITPAGEMLYGELVAALKPATKSVQSAQISQISMSRSFLTAGLRKINVELCSKAACPEAGD